MTDTLCSAAKILIIQAMQLKDFGHEGTGGEFWTNASKTALLEECAENAARAVLALVTPGKALAAAEPYAHEYGKTNGDGTFSVVIERGEPKNPVPDWPVKALYAAPVDHPDVVGVKIKDLEWVEDWTGGNDDIPSWRGNNPLGLHVYICFAGRLFNGRQIKRHDEVPSDVLADAKAAAQSDYETRIRSALQPLDSPEVVGEPVAYASQGQMDALEDRPDDPGGVYIPLRKTPLGLFRMPLYRSALQPSDSPALEARSVATVRVTHGGFGMELSTHVAYALPEGLHDLFASPAVAPVAVAPLRLHFDRETLRRKIEADGEEGEIGAGYEMFAAPVAPVALSKDTSRFNTLSSADDDTTPTSEDGKP
ncbi:hypothetical protein NL532_32055 [Mesorhizobium sp. C120A]|uniref:hypothetical protein n=1 Tax=unclassified Mesorhizobium TaxID=325217 RepID=UPI0003D0382C|nr:MULTISPECIES: hypothetical protein [unclassified Mesorhizobium]ESZ63758.1 hypothetical protein X728_09045 [Mesorhizobium sp. L103C120A0]WJI45077.1 hypothetical protein NL532_32055 [Mesorhizobium sp. C120A]